MPTRPLKAPVYLLVFTLVAAAASPVRAMMESPERLLHRAYFTEYVVEDCDEALSLYKRAAQSGLPDDMNAVANRGIERCRDRIVAADFSKLMPSDTLVYAELRRPGQLISALSEMLGLTPESMRALLDQRRDTATGAPVNIPHQVAISPTLLDAFSAFGGAAVGLTDFDFEGRRAPNGVLVIHHGDVKMMKGIIETAFQFAPTGQKIAGLPTFSSMVPEVGGVSGVLTEGLLIVGNDRNLVQGCADRLVGKETDSLRDREDLQTVFAERGDRTFFAFGDLNQIYKLAKERIHDHDRDDLIVANSFLDLENLKWATFTFGADKGALGMTARVCYADNHQSIVYNLMRLPPMARDVLKYVPDDAAAVFGIGLNPALASIAAGRVEDSQDVTGFDIPREIFGNIREIAAFVVPGPAGKSMDGRDPIPNAALVISSNDISRSKALWNELLRIPGLTVESGPVEPKKMTISGAEVTSYHIPELGSVYLAEVDNCLSIGLTRRAIRGVVDAHEGGKSIAGDKALAPAFARLPDSAGILLVGHVGRLAEVGAGMGEPEFVAASGPASKLCRNTTFWFGVGQSRTQLTLTGALMGLPDVNEALAMFGPMLGGHMQSQSQFQNETESNEETIAIDEIKKVEKVTY